MSDDLSLRLDVIDRQMVDADDIPIGRVDDLLADTAGAGALRFTSILTGAQAIGERLGGRRGRLMAAVARRLRAPAAGTGPTAVGCETIDEIGWELRLALPLRDLPHVAGLEHWLAEHVVGPFPRSGHAGD